MKKVIATVLTIVLILSMSACGAQSVSTSESGGSPGYGTDGSVLDKAQDMPAAPAAPEAVVGTSDSSVLPPISNGFIPGINQKIIFRSDMTLETETFDETLAKIDIKVKATGSYIETANISGNIAYQDELRYASLVIRVPSDRFEDMKKEAATWGHLISSNTSSQDVTKQYIDTEARLKALKIQEERLLALLGKAEKLDDILLLESRLSDVRYQIESYTGSLNELDTLVDYATIALTIHEVKSISVSPDNFGQRIAETIKDSFIQLGKFVESGLIALIYLIPYMIIIALLVFLIKKSSLASRIFRRKGKDDGDNKLQK
jgi:hypothetical protein